MTDSYRRPRTAPRQRRIRRAPGHRMAGVLAVIALAASPLTLLPQTAHAATARQVEDLDRGLISVRSGSGNLVSWRCWAPTRTTWRSTSTAAAPRSTPRRSPAPPTTSTPAPPADAAYTVRAVVERRRAGRLRARAAVPRRLPGRADLAAGRRHHPGRRRRTPTRPTTPASATSTATAATRSSSSGTRPTPRTTPSPATPATSTSTRYKLDGTRLWRIDLGRNIRAGAHYTQFQVYDYDGDGRAEVAMKTADGTGRRHRPGDRQRVSADHRNSSGYILTGPEYLTMFNGQTGAAMSTVNYVPAARHRLVLGRQLRQPGRPVPGRHRLPGRAAPLA